MKSKIQGQPISALLGKPALALAAMAAFALNANATPLTPVSAAPEVASSWIGGGVLALLGIEVLRRVLSGRKTMSGSR